MTMARSAGLHIGVIRPVATLRCDPVDILAGVFDIAGFAMHAVLEIDHKARVFALFLHHLIHTCGAIALRRFCVFGQVHRDRQVRVAQLQMAGLAFFVVCHRKADVGQAVKRQRAIGLWVILIVYQKDLGKASILLLSISYLWLIYD